MNQDAHQLKQKWQEVGDQISEAKYKLLNARQEQESLRGQIVPSPEKLKQVWVSPRAPFRRCTHVIVTTPQTLVDLSASIEKEKENLTKSNDQIRALGVRGEALAAADKDVTKVLRLLDELELEESRVKTLEKEHDECKAALQTNDEALHDATFREHQLNRQINSIQERTARMHRQHASKQEAAVEALDSAQREWNEVEAERKAAEAQIEQDELIVRAEREKVSHHSAHVKVAATGYSPTAEPVSRSSSA